MEKGACLSRDEIIAHIQCMNDKFCTDSKDCEKSLTDIRASDPENYFERDDYHFIEGQLHTISAYWEILGDMFDSFLSQKL